MKNNLVVILAVIAAAVVLGACTSYKSQEVSFRPPSAYPNIQTISGVQIAAEGFADSSAAKEAFGFDIRKAGLLPVQVIFDNKGSQGVQVVPEQTFLVDQQGSLWNLLDSRTAYKRVEDSSEYARIAKGAGKGSFLGAAGGALVGAAIGILSGENVGEAAAKGAAVGAAGGAVAGGADAGSSYEAGRQISRDLANKELKNRVVEPGVLSRGFLFFPGEASMVRDLRLQVMDTQGKRYTVTLPLY